MGYNIYIEFEDEPPYGVDVWTGYTDNVRAMFYYALECDVLDLNNKRVGDEKFRLERAIADVAMRPEFYHSLKPVEKWGSSTGVLYTLKWMHWWAKHAPNGIFKIR